MHRFVRGPAPVNLTPYRGRTWDSFAGTSDHARLGDALFALQNGYCAYCECRLASKQEGHIEHLERRSDCPSKAFDWNNLFFSCSHHDSCGKYKDEHKPKIRFNRADIVDPSKENPADFFTFTTTGIIRPKADCPNTFRASETIRVFNLNAKHLVQQRKRACANVFGLCGENPSEAQVTDFLSTVHVNNWPFLLLYEVLLNR